MEKAVRYIRADYSSLSVRYRGVRAKKKKRREKEREREGNADTRTEERRTKKKEEILESDARLPNPLGTKGGSALRVAHKFWTLRRVRKLVLSCGRGATIPGLINIG